MDITGLKGTENSDIYIIGSGSSLDYIPKSFFQDKVTIGVNTVCNHVPCKYTICHHYCVLQPIIDSGETIVVTSEYESCVLNSCIRGFKGPYKHDGTYENVPYLPLKGTYYYYKHSNQGYESIKIVDKDGWLTAGGTIVTEAIHFAYFLGAKNIILCGVDGGFIDGKTNVTGYSSPTNSDHMKNVQKQLEQISSWVRGRGVPVMSINPFINFTLEGHHFTL